MKVGWIGGKIRVGTDRETRDHRRERAGPRTWITEGRGGEKLQASQVKRCGDQSPTSKKNRSRDPRKPWPVHHRHRGLACLCCCWQSPPSLSPFPSRPVPAAAMMLGTAQARGGSECLRRKRICWVKRAHHPSGVPESRLDGPPHSLALRHAQIMNRYAVPPPATRYHPATELR